MKPPRLLLAALAAFASALCAQTPASDLPAFPGAEGFGATTPGGRGGRVIAVTNLNDSGPGSLRAACEAEGPRLVVFRVAGTIQLKSDLAVHHPFLTIAGQTAPGDGICLRDYTFGVATHDVIVRYLRGRLGDESKHESDALDILHGASNVIFDHCSATWSVDECLSLSGNVSNVTVQWCLIGESLRQSVHAKGAHGYGSLSRANGPVSWHHNLWIHNDARNPRLGDNYGKGPTFPTFDVRNNVIYDFGGTCSGLTQGLLKVNYVANYIRPGPSSTAPTPIHIGNKPLDSDITFFIRDNVFEGNAALTADNSKFIDAYELDGKKQAQTTPTPFNTAPVRTLSATEALAAVLASVGATLPARDSVDTRLIADVRNRTGRMINSQNEVGGWPELKAGAAPADSDGDGMPDAWEKDHGLNPNDAADGAQDPDKDGYTNLEEYLNGTNPRQFVDYRDAKNNVSPLVAK
ncbi:MAG: pectate lyase [Lacunisphaera sp.]|nr:pectate lyase [Lacunisphaera sp.]